MAEPRFYVTADLLWPSGNPRGYFVRYDNDKVFSYFGGRGRRQIEQALIEANKLRDEMNEREKTASWNVHDHAAA